MYKKIKKLLNRITGNQSNIIVIIMSEDEQKAGMQQSIEQITDNKDNLTDTQKIIIKGLEDFKNTLRANLDEPATLNENSLPKK